MTIKDIAAHCGVSTSTVSRVINDHPDVSPVVREMVNRAIEELHFIPNNSARTLVSSRSTAIGVVSRGVNNPFFSSVIRVLGREINDLGYTMVLQQISTQADEIRAAAALEREKKLLGVIFLGGRFNYTKEELEPLTVPFVCCTYTNTFGDLAEDEYSSVSIRDEDEAAKAVRYLIHMGHRRIAMILDDPADFSIGQLRFQGYKKALAEAGIDYDPALAVFTGDYAMDAAYDYTLRLIDSGADFTAILAISDTVAIAAIKALTDRGLRVPEDCSVIAIDGMELSAYTVPTLTTLRQPAEEMARQSADMLIGIIEGTGAHRHVLMETTLREGESVTAVPA